MPLRIRDIDPVFVLGRHIAGIVVEAEIAGAERMLMFVLESEDMAELVRLGAYKAGTNAEVDNAIKLQPALEAFLSQKKDEHTSLADGYAALDAIVGANSGKGN